MITSFRLRLALLSALLSGLALAVFGLGAWWLIRDIKIDHIDTEARAQAEREAPRQRDAADWQRTAANIRAGFGIRDESRLVLLVQDGNGATLYRSPHWPTGLDTARLPWPTPGNPPKHGGFHFWPLPAAHAAEPPPTPQEEEPRRPPPGERPPPRRDDDVNGADDDNRPQAPPKRGSPPATAFHAENVEGRHWRIGLAATERARIAVAVDAGVVDAEMAGIRSAFLLSMPLALLLIGLGSWLFAARALRPLQKLSAATSRVTAEGLDQRIASAGEDREFVELIEKYNHMLERLDRSFQQAHRFSADAAHELKTPLAILQGQLERAIQVAEEGSPMQAELSSILDEVRRLSTISRKLLLLSQADAGRLNLHRESFDLSRALADLLEDTRMMAPQLQVSGDIPSGLNVSVDASLFPQVLHNLISNAIKYNVARGWISITAARTGQGVEVCVSNSSPGIPLAQQGKLFERFYRADSAHSRHVEGVGLGLSVSREIARAHGGDITLSTDGEGTVRLTLRLPYSVQP